MYCFSNVGHFQSQGAQSWVEGLQGEAQLLRQPGTECTPQLARIYTYRPTRLSLNIHAIVYQYQSFCRGLCSLVHCACLYTVICTILFTRFMQLHTLLCSIVIPLVTPLCTVIIPQARVECGIQTIPISVSPWTMGSWLFTEEAVWWSRHFLLLWLHTILGEWGSGSQISYTHWDVAWWGWMNSLHKQCTLGWYSLCSHFGSSGCTVTLIVTTHFIQLPVHDLTYLLIKSISPGRSVHSTHVSHGCVELFPRDCRLLPLPHRSSGIVFLCTTDALFIRLYSCELHMKGQ